MEFHALAMPSRGQKPSIGGEFVEPLGKCSLDGNQHRRLSSWPSAARGSIPRLDERRRYTDVPYAERLITEKRCRSITSSHAVLCDRQKTSHRSWHNLLAKILRGSSCFTRHVTRRRLTKQGDEAMSDEHKPDTAGVFSGCLLSVLVWLTLWVIAYAVL